jgi:hypothetical protein
LIRSHRKTPKPVESRRKTTNRLETTAIAKNTSEHHSGRRRTQKTPLNATNTLEMIRQRWKTPQKAAVDLEIAQKISDKNFPLEVFFFFFPVSYRLY